MMNTMNGTYCETAYPWEFIVFLPFAVVSFVVNFFLFLATAINRKKLERQNYIHACVISALLCNILFVVIQVSIMVDGYMGHDLVSGKSFKTVWTLCQSAAVSIQFIMCGNIGALLYVVLDSTYFVGRSVNRKASTFAEDFNTPAESVSKRRWMFSAKRRRATFFIVVAWIIPICFVVASTVTWNCSEYCVYCRGGLAKEDVCARKFWCSQTWAPVHITYLIVHLVLWIVEIVVLIILILWGIYSFRQVMAPPSHDSTSFNEDDNVKRLGLPAVPASAEETGCTVKLDEDIKQEEQQDKVTASNCSALQQATAKKRHSIRKASLRLHSRIIFMIVISVTFVFCTIPLIVSFFMDIFKVSVHAPTAIGVSTFFIYVYTICCPIILLKFLPNLKLVLSSLISNISYKRWSKLYRRRSLKSKPGSKRIHSTGQ